IHFVSSRGSHIMDQIFRSLSGDGGLNSAPAHLQGAMMRVLRAGEPLTVASLRALSPFTEDAQKIIDDAVVSVGLDRLTVAADVMAEGLIFNLPNAMSVMEVQWDQEAET